MVLVIDLNCFNTQPPEGGWPVFERLFSHYEVSTHSRLKAAGAANKKLIQLGRVSTHSRLKAAGL